MEDYIKPIIIIILLLILLSAVQRSMKNKNKTPIKNNSEPISSLAQKNQAMKDYQERKRKAAEEHQKRLQQQRQQSYNNKDYF